MSLTVTNNDLGNVVVKPGEFRDELITVAAAITIKEGTILARDSVSLKLVPYVKGGIVNENGIPKAIITYEVSATAAGDIPVRAMSNGVVSNSRLVIQADGDATNVDNAVRDQLRDYALITVDVQELNIQDNQ